MAIRVFLKGMLDPIAADETLSSNTRDTQKLFRIAHGAFKVYEPRDLITRLFLLCGLPILNVLPTFNSHNVLSLFITFALHILGLSISILLYRFSPWHPLASFPGPFLARGSNLWMSLHSVGGKRHLLMRDLHARYGNCVRIGPNMISIIEVDAVVKCFQDSQIPRSEAYRAYEPDHMPAQVVSSRSICVPNHLDVHAEKRETWTKGFTSSALEDYGVFLEARVIQLVNKLEEKSDEDLAIDLPEWFRYFTWDFMGDLVFGGGFSMMQDGEDKSGFWEVLEGLLVAQTPLIYFPWLNNFLHLVPASLAKGPLRLRQLAEKCMNERVKRPNEIKDLYHYFAREDDPPHLQPTKDALVTDSFVGILAGGDTTASTLSALFFQLLQHPDVMRKLRDEIHALDGEILTTAGLASLPYLNACINETLRLFPPVPIQLSRTPAIGKPMTIAGRYIPEGTTVYVSPMLLGRDPRHFSPYTESFWPDRWLNGCTVSGGVHKMQAFLPFSTGATACVGAYLVPLPPSPRLTQSIGDLRKTTIISRNATSRHTAHPEFRIQLCGRL
ncbi:cytochrome P450 [Flagelloscypha sp. PMI_526]|nr:cytochrome P450 [Flagelloscypha sp. PMI_526]